jgi:hypothetical protein
MLRLGNGGEAMHAFDFLFRSNWRHNDDLTTRASYRESEDWKV